MREVRNREQRIRVEQHEIGLLSGGTSPRSASIPSTLAPFTVADADTWPGYDQALAISSISRKIPGPCNVRCFRRRFPSRPETHSPMRGRLSIAAGGVTKALICWFARKIVHGAEHLRVGKTQFRFGGVPVTGKLEPMTRIDEQRRT